MKLLAAAIFLLSSAFSSSTLAQTANTTVQNFTLSQAASSLNLEQKEFETIYETQQVPSTCYRSEVQGTVTQCHTEYDHQCQTHTEQSCNQVPHQVCQNVPRPVCVNHSVCQTTTDHVCHGVPPNQVCQNVPRPVCHTEQSCHTENSSVCHTEYTNQCHQVPVTTCHDIPRQVCNQVPNVVQVPYACTKPVQVAVGQQLKMDTQAAVTVTLLNFAEVGAIADQFTATLASGVVTLKLTAPSKTYLFQVVSQNQTEQVISATEKHVKYEMSIIATPIAKLNASIAQFQTLEISSLKFYFDRLEYQISGAFQMPTKGHLNIVRKGGFLGSNQTIINGDFKASDVTVQNGLDIVSYSLFGAAALDSKNHTVTLTLSPDLDGLKKNLLNPDAVSLIQNSDASIEMTVGGYPLN